MSAALDSATNMLAAADWLMNAMLGYMLFGGCAFLFRDLTGVRIRAREV